MKDSVSIVLPVFNQLHHTTRCLESVLEGTEQPGDLVVIDNNSTDDTPRYLLETMPKFEKAGFKTTVITNGENKGVAGAWNQGIREASGDYVAILNNDTWLMPGWDGALVKWIKRLGAGMVGPYYYEGPFESDIKKRAERFVRRNAGKRSADWVSILMLFDRKVFDAVGLFDERYFVTHEDIDFRLRMEEKGFSYFQVAECFIWHHAKGTRGGSEEFSRIEREAARKFEEKWGFNLSERENTLASKMKRSWKSFKNRRGLF